MATFLQGVTDTPAPMQLYKPDYEFLTQVYNSRQSSYDKGFNYVKNLYNSQLNNPLTSLDNEKYRQDVFKKIQSTLKDASALDLSNPANINYALQAMDPITKDKQLAYDMHVTGVHQGELQKLEAVRSSLDPKVSATYNEYSKKAINYATSDLREAKRDDGSIFKVGTQKFIPYQDVVADLNKAAKEQNLGIEIESATGTGYLIKQSNGELAYKPYTKWALSAMGNKYDAQLQQQGYVEGEGVIRGTMQKEGVDRTEAINKIAPSMFKQLYQEAVQNHTYSDARIKEYDLQISKFRDKYGNKGIDPNSTEGKALAEIVKQKNGYVNDLATAKADLNSMEEQGNDYVTSNLYNIFTNQAKKRMAMDWAVGHADATKKIETSSDATWMGKMHEAHQDARHMQDINLRSRALDETIRNNKFNNTIAQQNADINMFKLKFGPNAKFPKETWAGEFSGSEISGITVLGNDLEKTENNMFDKAFSSVDGLIGVLYNNDSQHKDLQTISPIITKMKNIANGADEKLTSTEMAKLTDFGKRSGITIYNVANSAQAKYALREMAMGTFAQAQIKIETYKKTKDVRISASKLAAFEGIRDDFKRFADTMGNIEKNYANLAAETYDPRTHDFKPLYKNRGLTINGYTSKGTPMINVSGLTGSPDEIAATLQTLEKRVNPEYQGKSRPAGSKLIAENMKPEEYSQLFSYSVNIDDDERTNLSKNLNEATIKNIYGPNAEIGFDPGKEMVNVTIKGDAAKVKSYNKATSSGSIQQSYTFQIPYAQVANTPALARFNKYIDSNTVTSANTSTLSKLVKNPTATINSPDESKNGIGFSWHAIGDKTASGGRYGINLVLNYEDPTSGKEVSVRKFIQQGDNESREAAIARAEKILNEQRHSYESYRIQHDESFTGSNNMTGFDTFINSIPTQ